MLNGKKKLTAGFRRGLAVLSLFAMLVSGTGFGAVAQQPASRVSRLTEEQRIVHVLNRLGFGARPGDVARVKSIGLTAYINQQLNPEKIDDAVAEARLQNLSTLSMTTAKLYEKFPQPGMLMRQLERRGELPSTIADARKDGKSAAPAANDSKPTATTNDGSMTSRPENPALPLNPQENQEYRRALRQYYAQNGLQLPQRIIAELQASRILRAVYSERQLNEVMVDFWSNHFNVFAGKGADRWLLTSYDRDTIRPNAMGKFSDLLVATAQSPAMLFYLDNFQSVSPNASQAGRGNRRGRMLLGGLAGNRQERMNRDPDLRMQRQDPGRPPQPANAQQARRGINENYARELMELHTLGVEGGYTQKDVQEVARCFTGWTIFAPRGAGAAAATLMGETARANAGRFFFNPRVHDDGEKIVLGHKIPAGGGFKDGLTVLEILAHHPATAKFIARKLVRHFVADDPPAALVERVATTFSKTDGNIRETLRTIVFSPEFNSPESYRAKVKRPFELAISAVRTLGGETNGSPQFHQWIAQMGEPLYGYQTPNGYSDTAESWVNTGGLLERLNFGLALASNRIPGTRVDLKSFFDGQLNAKALDNRQVMDRFLDIIVGGEISAATKETLIKQMSAEITVQPPESRMAPAGDVEMSMGPRSRQPGRMEAQVNDPVTKIVGLILGSPEFQRQ
jgi:uncharacterized protein (DUF1800 family)